jgi:hypothetical protein
MRATGYQLLFGLCCRWQPPAGAAPQAGRGGCRFSGGSGTDRRTPGSPADSTGADEGLALRPIAAARCADSGLTQASGSRLRAMAAAELIAGHADITPAELQRIGATLGAARPPLPPPTRPYGPLSACAVRCARDRTAILQQLGEVQRRLRRLPRTVPGAAPHRPHINRGIRSRSAGSRYAGPALASRARLGSFSLFGPGHPLSERTHVHQSRQQAPPDGPDRRSRVCRLQSGGGGVCPAGLRRQPGRGQHGAAWSAMPATGDSPPNGTGQPSNPGADAHLR